LTDWQIIRQIPGMGETYDLRRLHKDTTVVAGKKVGRRKGGRKRGFYWRSGRGWFALIGGKSVPLKDRQGNKLAVRGTPLDVLEAAHKQLLAEVQAAQVLVASGDTMPVMEVMRSYLDHCQHSNRSRTYDVRSRLIFDFCTGFPAAFRNKKEKPKQKDRIHQGYGSMRVCDLEPRHVAEWCKAHEGWGSHRMAKQAVKRALSWAASPEGGLISSNPLAAMKVPRSKKRVTYFTTEQETAICDAANSCLALLIRVLIRTGCRPGELISLTANHVEETPQGMIWRFKADQHKTGEHTGDRIVRLPDEMAQLTRELMAQHPTGPLFRNTQNGPWVDTALRGVFVRLKTRLAKRGVVLDKDACLYSCRHTYAKRMLGGFWNGKPTTIEQLCALMGNSREICWEHYGKWSKHYEDPLWDAVR
jgi:integrase